MFSEMLLTGPAVEGNSYLRNVGTTNRSAPRHIAADLNPYRPGAISLQSYELLLFKLSLVIYFNPYRTNVENSVSS